MSAGAQTAAAAVAAAPVSPAMRSFEAQWRAGRPGALHALREAAMRRFLELGLPTTRDDSWRHTSLRLFDAQSFADAAAGGTRTATLCTADAEEGTLRIVNGVPHADDLARLKSGGLQITGIGDLSRTDPALLRRFLEPLSDAEQRRFALLNTALFADGVYLRVLGAAPPLRLLHVTVGASAVHPRVIIDAAPGSSATIVEHHLSENPSGGDAGSLCNSVTQIAADAGARIEHYRVFAGGAEAANVDSLDLRLARDSLCRQFTVCIGGGLVRTTLEARLEAPGAALESFALLVGHGSRHADCVNVATHAAPDTRSRQTARAIAGGESRVVFNSKVIVEAGAVRSESMQSCRGLLMSPDAEIDTRPQLEIHADEVKCAHGATTGRLDPDMLFYMLSRGLDRATAQSLLVYAFLADVLTGMSATATRAAVEKALIAQLPESQLLRELR